MLRRERKSSFLILEHLASRSRLVVSMWRTNERVNRVRCEELARLRRDLPKRGADLASASVAAPVGFDTHVHVGLRHADDGALIDGYAVAFGSNRQRCFAFAYTTTALGPDAERLVGERLAIIQSRSLAAVEQRLDTEPDPSRPSR